jgi:hypothetical protein
MKKKLVFISTIIANAVCLSGVASAQECDRCAFASYLEGALNPGAPHHVALELNYTYRSKTFEGSSERSGAPEEKVADTVLNLFYEQPLFNHFSLDFNLPVVSRAYTLRPNNTYESDRETSLGDASILADVHIIENHSSPLESEWRLRGGVKLPTGDSDDLNDFEASNHTDFGGSAVYPYDLAKGTGSVDWIAGTSVFMRYDRVVGFVDGQYTARTEGENNFRFGDTAVVQGAPGYLFAVSGPNSLGLFANTTFKYSGEAEQDGDTVENTGQKTLSVGPELLFTVRDAFSATVGVNFPVYRDVNGRQLAQAYDILASVFVSF